VYFSFIFFSSTGRFAITTDEAASIFGKWGGVPLSKIENASGTALEILPEGTSNNHREVIIQVVGTDKARDRARDYIKMLIRSKEPGSGSLGIDPKSRDDCTEVRKTLNFFTLFPFRLPYPNILSGTSLAGTALRSVPSKRRPGP
jgi:hypothetical protein